MPTDLLSIARDVALKAGALAKQRRAEGVEVAASKSSPVDIVTEADRETEVLIRLAIRAQQGEPLDQLVAELPHHSTTPALQPPR